MEEGESYVDAPTRGTLSFVHENNMPDGSAILGCWLQEMLNSNGEAKKLLNSTLRNGNIRVVLKQPGTGGYCPQQGCYMTSNREICLNIDSMTRRKKLDFDDQRISLFRELDANKIEDTYKVLSNHGFFSDSATEIIADYMFYIDKMLLLNTFIFELGNSVNESVHKVKQYNFLNGEEFATALEKAEFETQLIIRPAIKYGVSHCRWNSVAFAYTKDTEELKKYCYTDKGPHYQGYVKAYNRNRVRNKALYYLKNNPTFLSAATLLVSFIVYRAIF